MRKVNPVQGGYSSGYWLTFTDGHLPQKPPTEGIDMPGVVSDTVSFARQRGLLATNSIE